MKDRIVALLSQNIQQKKISEIVGCSEAYVSQVANDPDTLKEVEATKKRNARAAEEEALEEGYVRLERKTLAQIEENLPFADFRDLALLMNTMIQKRQKHVPVNAIIHNDNRKVVMLQVPSSVLPGEIILNQNREMIAVGNQTLAPMTSVGVKDLFTKLKDKKESLKLLEQAEKVDLKNLTEMPEDF